jgi:hypothetical protein
MEALDGLAALGWRGLAARLVRLPSTVGISLGTEQALLVWLAQFAMNDDGGHCPQVVPAHRQCCSEEDSGKRSVGSGDDSRVFVVYIEAVCPRRVPRGGTGHHTATARWPTSRSDGRRRRADGLGGRRALLDRREEDRMVACLDLGDDRALGPREGVGGQDGKPAGRSGTRRSPGTCPPPSMRIGRRAHLAPHT